MPRTRGEPRMSNRELAKFFACGGHRGMGYGHIFIEGDVIYSYGHHFPIAVRTPSGYLFNKDRYSRATGKQKYYVREALKYENVREVSTAELDAYIRNARHFSRRWMR